MDKILNYIKKDSTLMSKEVFPLLNRIDTIIFDIDGVLVNVDKSYRQTITDTVRYYFNNIIDNLSGTENLADTQTLESFKMAGGFNDDWELTASIILFYIWKMKKYKITSLESLKRTTPLIVDFVNKNLNDAGGLQKLICWITKNNEKPGEIFALWHKEKIFQIAMEYYAGENKCFEFYNFYPGIIDKVRGNIEKETTIIELKLENNLRKYNVGILSGRNQKEADYIINKIGWNGLVNSEMIITQDAGIKKPSPAGLEYFIRKFDSKVGLYIGDTMDDLLTVKNLNNKQERKIFLSSIVIGENLFGGKDKVNHYLANDVDLLAENVNQIVRFVSQS